MSKKAFLLTALLFLSAANCHADIIKLKNGNKIACENVREIGEKVEYNIGESTFAVSKSSVQSIDKTELSNERKNRCAESALKPVIPLKHSTGAIPMKTEFLCRQLGYRQSSPGISPPLWMDRCARILQGGSVNVHALEEVENECNSEMSAAAYYVAGNFDHTAQNDEGAAEYLKVAAEYSPNQPEILLLYIEVLNSLGRFGEAVPIAERAAAQIGPNALVILGNAYYYAGRRNQAVQSWKLYLDSQQRGGSVESFIYQADAFLDRHGQKRSPSDYENYDNYRYRHPVIK
jgi:hypothetical protein